MQLVYVKNRSSEPYTLSSVIAECAEVQHRTVQRLINTHKESLGRFGKVRFQITPSPSGQNIKDYKLNEPQATLLITFMRNTAKVIEFKEALVKEFYSMRAELNRFKVKREIEKLYHSQLNEAIDNWIYKNPHSYMNIASLLCQVVTGLIPRQLRAQHGASKEVAALDLMTADELGQYSQKVVQATICLQQQQTYSEIKANLLAA